MAKTHRTVSVTFDADTLQALEELSVEYEGNRSMMLRRLIRDAAARRRAEMAGATNESLSDGVRRGRDSNAVDAASGSPGMAA